MQKVVTSLHEAGLEVSEFEALEALRANELHVGRTINRLKAAIEIPHTHTWLETPVRLRKREVQPFDDKPFGSPAPLRT